MDPLTQGVVGASLPQSLLKNKKLMIFATLFGFLSGMAADLDVLIQSKTDSLMYLQYHRQFTHSFVFIPVGAAICAGVFWLIFRRKIPFRATFWFCLLGYGTHALLDACTSYGTQLFWPFTDYRVAWNIVSVFDPVFTLPALILVAVAFFKKQRLFARIALGWMLFYLSLGFWQNQRATAAAEALIKQRGHQASRLEVKPSFANLLVWKIIYETETHYFVDAVRLALAQKVYAGDKIEKLVLERDFPERAFTKKQKANIERFRWFSDGYLAKDPTRENFVMDMRYSMVPNEIDPMWGIALGSGESDPVDFRFVRKMTKAKREKFMNMLKGRDL